jgi:3-hydroxymyristoyl/3-hydroxydecanoyl-(acyl carrier protein) dehydratase
MRLDKELDFQIKVQRDNFIVGYFKPDPKSHYFQGHFPGYPIVPGVLLLEVSLRLLAVALGVPRPELKVNSLKKASFLKPVFPTDYVEVQLKIDGNDAKVIGFHNVAEVFRCTVCFEISE